MHLEYLGFAGLVIVAADAYAIGGVVLSNASARVRAAWTAVVLLLPVMGFILWSLSGPKPTR